MTSSVLIANRGEIACRITRTAHRLGMRVIAVFSDADRNALHARLADDAYRIGAEQAADSYLDASKVIEAARKSGAQFIHPGYGFLSENAEFARACKENGIVFVGPPAAAIEAMGLKDAAKQLMQDAGVPVVPGYQGDNQDADHLAQEATAIGYPVLIKAVAGGGGKGMRKVVEPSEFAAALSACRREAKSAFDDDKVLIERFVKSPRHIEVQIFCDTHGNAVHLYERDCSMQRRHQKVIEEAPAPGMPEAMRTAICKAAVKAAQAVDYVGAGTVEFIADGSDGLRGDAFFFMEMNTRLQVEHPVTEAITGIDLVEWQLRVAAGEPLQAKQNEISITGHAIEARLYAEDPANGFLPQTGTVHRIMWPPETDGVRIDTGVQDGDPITPFYDPMLAKLICHAPDRSQAAAKLRTALQQTQVFGLRTNLGFCHRLVSGSQFIEASHDTSTIDDNIEGLTGDGSGEAALLLAAEAWSQSLRHTNGKPQCGPWESLTGWSLQGTPRSDRMELMLNGSPITVRTDWSGAGKTLAITRGDGKFSAYLSGIALDDDELSVLIEGQRQTAQVLFADPGEQIFINYWGEHITVAGADVFNRQSETGSHGTSVSAPMSGRIISVTAEPGQEVTKGEQLAILEAMKMEHPLIAGFDATIKSVNASIDDQVEEGFVVIELSGHTASGS